MISISATRLRWLVAAGVAALLLAAAATSPMGAIRATVDQVITILKEPTLDRPTRRARVVAVVRQRFDYPAMARSTLATYWREASPAQRDAFTDRFTQLLEAT